MASAASNNIDFHSKCGVMTLRTQYVDVAHLLPHGFTALDVKRLGEYITSNVILSDPATTSARVARSPGVHVHMGRFRSYCCCGASNHLP